MSHDRYFSSILPKATQGLQEDTQVPGCAQVFLHARVDIHERPAARNDEQALVQGSRQFLLRHTGRRLERVLRNVHPRDPRVPDQGPPGHAAAGARQMAKVQEARESVDRTLARGNFRLASANTRFDNGAK